MKLNPKSTLNLFIALFGLLLGCVPAMGQDCNINGVPDLLDLDLSDPDGNGEVSSDCDGDASPDECELPLAIASFSTGSTNESIAFAQSVAIGGNTIFIGASDDETGTFAGLVYVYQLEATGWQLDTTIIAPDPSPNANFGCDIAIDQDTLVIGAFLDDQGIPNSGSAYIFQRTGENWAFVSKLRASDPEQEDQFGCSVSISGERIIVGAWLDNDNGSDKGSAYVFKKIGQTWQQVAKLKASDAAAFDQFGFAVCIKNDLAVVGAQGNDQGATGVGAAYLYRETSGAWQQRAKLQPASPIAFSGFGSSISIDGSGLLIGSRFDDVTETNSGSAYYFEGTNDSWTQVQKIKPADPSNFAQFGSSIVLQGDTAVIGAEWDNFQQIEGCGAAYLFRRVQGVWRQTAKMRSSEPNSYDLLGGSIALEGESLIVGGRGGDDNSGSGRAILYDLFATGTDCYGDGTLDECDLDCNEDGTYDRCELANGQASDCNRNGILDECEVLMNQDSDCNANGLPDDCERLIAIPVQTQFLCPSQLSSFSGFGGGGICTQDGIMLIGASGDDVVGAPERGSVYSYRLINGVWSLEAEFAAASSNASDRFGSAIAMNGNVAIIGAPNAESPGFSSSGKAYVFHRSENTWLEIQQLLPPTSTNNAGFGRTAVTNGAIAVVGAPIATDPVLFGGAAYVYRNHEGTWEYEITLRSPDTQMYGEFASSVAIENDTIVIGARYTNSFAYHSGAVYIFRWTDGDWQQIATILSPTPDMNDQFGTSVSIASDTIIVGSPGSDDRGVDSGAVFVFKEVNGSWQFVDRLAGSDQRARDAFGSFVAVAGQTIAIGATLHDHAGMLNSGAVYVFKEFDGERPQIAKIVSSDAATDDVFGSRIYVAEDESELLIAATGDDVAFSASGSVYRFTLEQAINDCDLNGGLDECQSVNDHIESFVLALLNNSQLPHYFCTFDGAPDGELDGRDIAAFVEFILN